MYRCHRHISDRVLQGTNNKRKRVRGERERERNAQHSFRGQAVVFIMFFVLLYFFYTFNTLDSKCKFSSFSYAACYYSVTWTVVFYGFGLIKIQINFKIPRINVTSTIAFCFPLLYIIIIVVVVIVVIISLSITLSTNHV